MIIASNWNATHTIHVHSHQNVPARSISQSVSSRSGAPITTREHRALHEIDEKELLRHAIEAELFLDHEMADVVERQVDDARDRDDRRHQRDLPEIAAAEPVRNGEIERLDAAEQRQRDEHDGARDDFDHREARALDGVIRGALMRGQRDRAGELRGTPLRCAATWRICRDASQSLVETIATRATTKIVEKARVRLVIRDFRLNYARIIGSRPCRRAVAFPSLRPLS